MVEAKRFENILDIIGSTPLLKLKGAVKDIDFDVFAKLEFLNPTGSIKDRTAKYMILKAEKEGRLKRGDTIIENSSGNMAISLAIVAIQRGYKLKVVVRDTISKEKLKILHALGVETIKADTTLPPESPNSYNHLATNIAKEMKCVYFPDQHNNRENNEAHYNTTGPEIWEQMEGRIDYLIAGMGTGGTIGGAGKFLKEKNPKIKIIAVDIEGSIFTQYFKTKKIVKPKPYLLEGLGDEFLIGCADFEILDDIIQVSDEEAFFFTKKICKEEGILAGGSSGAALCAILKYSANIPKNARVVTIFPDSAFRYVSTIFDDDWLLSKGLNLEI
ncbi:MAG: PLP-dependent cysteine synthase family protein [Acidobacteriota bacterium]